MTEVLITQASIAAILGIVTQIAKYLKIDLNKNLITIFNFAIGGTANVFMAIIQNRTNINYIDFFIAGALSGLVASGGYDCIKGLGNQAKKLITKNY